MTLDSGDRVFFDITPTHMTLQLLEGVAKGSEEDDERAGCDTVVLYGKDVALLLRRLTAEDDGPVVASPEGSTLSDLTVWSTWRIGVNGEKQWRMVSLKGDNNNVTMEGYECDMLVKAIESRVWRLFQ